MEQQEHLLLLVEEQQQNICFAEKQQKLSVPYKEIVIYNAYSMTAITPAMTGNIDDWCCVIGKTGGATPNNVLVDGVASGTATSIPS